MIKNYFLLFSATLILAGCGNKNNTGNDLRGSISIDGSSTVYPLTEAMAEEFRREAPDVRVTVGLSGTGGGFKKFSRGEIDINNASRNITEGEAEDCKKNNITYTELKVAYDGLAVVVSPENTWCKEITVAELKKMWEPAAQGTIKKWNQIRSSWPDEEIHLFGAGVESGTYDYFTEVIVGKSHSSRGDYTASEDDNVLVQGIKGDKNALGFFGLAYYTENQDKLRLVAVDDEIADNGAGPILPTVETVKNKTYSPLGRPLFIYVNSEAGKRKEVQEFTQFYLGNTEALAGDVGYIALAHDEIEKEKEKFSTFIESLKTAQ